MANDVYMLIMQGTCAGEFWETVQHYESNTSGAPNPVAVASNLIAGFQGQVQPDVLAIMADDTEITGYKAKRVNNGGSPTVMLPITPIAGSVAGTSCTSATASCIVSSFSHAGKFHTGRWFIPGLPEGDLAGNTFSAGHIAACATLVVDNATFTNGGATFTYGVWSPKFSLFFVPAYVALSPKPGIQRRRLLPVM